MMPGDLRNYRQELKDAVYANFLSEVEGAMGAGDVREVIKEYGFTGPFAGLKTLGESVLQNALEEEFPFK